VDYLIYGRAAAGAGDQDDAELDEAHWSFMDAFADRLIVRGPTLSADRSAWTGSLHVVDLPDAEAARAFAVDEPYQRAGLFAEHLIRRFDNHLGRTMWDGPRAGGDDLPFLVLAEGGDGVRSPSPSPSTAGAPPPSLAPDVAARLVAWGTLYPVDGDGPAPAGTALVLLAPDEDAVRTVLAAEPALLGGHRAAQLHAWEFGGRR
jgi:hypothetical protein